MLNFNFLNLFMLNFFNLGRDLMQSLKFNLFNFLKEFPPLAIFVLEFPQPLG